MKMIRELQEGRSMGFAKLKAFARKSNAACKYNSNVIQDEIHSLQSNSDVNAQYSEMEIINT